MDPAHAGGALAQYFLKVTAICAVSRHQQFLSTLKRQALMRNVGVDAHLKGLRVECMALGCLYVDDAHGLEQLICSLTVLCRREAKIHRFFKNGSGTFKEIKARSREGHHSEAEVDCGHVLHVEKACQIFAGSCGPAIVSPLTWMQMIVHHA